MQKEEELVVDLLLMSSLKPFFDLVEELKPAFITFGPVIGEITATTARVLVEVSEEGDVECYLFAFSNPTAPIIRRQHCTRHTPKAFSFVDLVPDTRYTAQFNLGYVNSSSPARARFYTYGSRAANGSNTVEETAPRNVRKESGDELPEYPQDFYTGEPGNGKKKVVDTKIGIIPGQYSLQPYSSLWAVFTNEAYDKRLNGLIHSGMEIIFAEEWESLILRSTVNTLQKNHFSSSLNELKEEDCTKYPLYWEQTVELFKSYIRIVWTQPGVREAMASLSNVCTPIKTDTLETNLRCLLPFRLSRDLTRFVIQCAKEACNQYFINLIHDYRPSCTVADFFLRELNLSDEIYYSKEIGHVGIILSDCNCLLRTAIAANSLSLKSQNEEQPRPGSRVPSAFRRRTVLIFTSDILETDCDDASWISGDLHIAHHRVVGVVERLMDWVPGTLERKACLVSASSNVTSCVWMDGPSSRRRSSIHQLVQRPEIRPLRGTRGVKRQKRVWAKTTYRDELGSTSTSKTIRGPNEHSVLIISIGSHQAAPRVDLHWVVENNGNVRTQKYVSEFYTCGLSHCLVLK